GKEFAGLAWLDLSTGHFQAADVSWQRLGDELSRLNPAEFLCAERDAGRLGEPLGRFASATLTSRPDWTFEMEAARGVLFRHLGVTTLAGFGFDDGQLCLSAAGGLFSYVQETLKADLAHIRR